MEAIYRSFSCGRLGVATEVLGVVSRAHALNVFENLSSDTSLLEEWVPGLMSVLLAWSAQPTTDLWRREVGRIERAASGGSDACAVPCVELGLSIAGEYDYGYEPWNFRFAEPHTLSFDIWSVPSVISGTISSDGKFMLKLADGRLIHSAGNVLTDHANLNSFAFSEARVRIPNGTITILPGAAVSSEIIPPHAKVRFASTESMGDFSAVLVDAFDLLARCSPRYAEWVSSVVRYVTPLSAPSGQLGSSSSPWECGLVALTHTPHSVAVAEMLVHEASHQIFFLAKRLGPMDDGKDDALYFSPMARQLRHIERILLAYHALGNIVLMYEDVARFDSNQTVHCQKQIEKSAPKIIEMEKILSQTKSLTKIGDAIYEPLRKEVLTLFQSRSMSSA